MAITRVGPGSGAALAVVDGFGVDGLERGADSIFLNTGRCTTNPDFLRLPTRLRECPGPKLWVGCLLLVSGSVVTYGEAEGLFVLMVKNVLFSTHSREG